MTPPGVEQLLWFIFGLWSNRVIETMTPPGVEQTANSIDAIRNEE